MSRNVVDMAEPHQVQIDNEPLEDFSIPGDCSSDCCGIDESDTSIPTDAGVIVIVGKMRKIPFSQPLYVTTTKNENIANLQYAFRYIKKHKSDPKCLNGLFLHSSDIQFCYFTCSESDIAIIESQLLSAYRPTFSTPLLSLQQTSVPTWS